jgi:uncharacterized protein (DUF2252 family)
LWEAPSDRPDPVALLQAQDAARVPELVPIRYGRMLVSPFAFFRGAAAVMAADLARTARTGIHAQLCGDAHLANFGVFAAPDRRLVFDLNDFDETLEGPWEWDVKRLAASVEIAGRDRGFGSSARREAVVEAVGQYRAAMRRAAGMRHLEVWYTRLEVDEIMALMRELGMQRQAKVAQRGIAKAQAKNSLRAVSKLTARVDGTVRFISDPPLLVPLTELIGNTPAHEFQQLIEGLLERYAESLAPDRRHLLRMHRFVDMARKVVGVGSVGTRAWVLLLEGRDGEDPLVLQAKEAQASVLEAHLPRSPYRNHGRRVVEGQRFMQASSDIFLGWEGVVGMDGRDRDFYIRQLWDGKGSVDLTTIEPVGLRAYARVCGWTLARAHARSGDRFAIAGYLGRGDTFDRAVADFAAAYADQNERDYAALQAAAADGRVTAQHGL